MSLLAPLSPLAIVCAVSKLTCMFYIMPYSVTCRRHLLLMPPRECKLQTVYKPL